MFGSDCFVVTATRDINVNDRIVLLGAATNGCIVVSRGSLCKLTFYRFLFVVEMEMTILGFRHFSLFQAH
jgi:hypothetical protein